MYDINGILEEMLEFWRRKWYEEWEISEKLFSVFCILSFVGFC